MSDTIGKYWFSDINMDNISVIDEVILDEITKLYSSNYGNWIDTGTKVTLSPKKFLSQHKQETIYFVSNQGGEIIGFSSVSTRKYKVKIITSMCVKKEYRNQGIGTSLITYILNRICEDGTYRIGVVTPNPVLLLTLETHPELEYIDLEEEVLKDKVFGIQLSIFIDEFRRKSYSLVSSQYKRIEEISYKKIDTGFTVDVPEEELNDGLGEFYRNLMGKLNPGEEWILFCKYESKVNNKI